MKIIHLLVLSSFILVGNALAQSPAPIKFVDFVLTPNHDDWDYKVNENATVQVSVLQFGVPIKNVSVDYEIGPELLPAEKKGNVLFKTGEGKIDIGTSKQPGFRQLKLRTSVNGKVYTGEIKVAYSPQDIQPTVQMPDDFMQFWNKAKEEASKVPMDAIVTHLPDQSTTTVDVYLVNLQSYKKGRRLFGYLSKPKAPGKYPVLFEPPGAGIKPINPSIAYANEGFIVMNIEIHGITPLISTEAYQHISSAFGDYMHHKLDDRDNYYYKSVYMGCLRAIDFLCSLPEFDGKNVVATGGSQGGALAIVTAALDKRVTCVSAFYPALSDMTGYLHGRAGGWPHLLNATNQSINNKPEKVKTLAYYDVANFAKHIIVPGFYSWGYNDNVVPPTSVFAAVNSIKAPKTISITPISGHWRFAETNQESLEWIKKQVGQR
ncbi:acetylxylan esterase [Aridibaculum aurantiacum]|uniref:acetylxylan esterase n=1 Tax=Aridibaculum aurantiacum TaxID=2810307 RepID=UPI001A96DE3F|nr:acetylxylan esterase [Aridibaculum aurantiacum]